MGHSYGRQLRIADLIRKEIAGLIQFQTNDPRFKNVTVTDISLSKDMSRATIYVSFLQTDEKKDIIKALNKAASFLRCRLAEKADMRYTPKLEFSYDETLAQGRRITDIISQHKDI